MNKCKRTAKLYNLRQSVVSEATAQGQSEADAHATVTKILRGISNKRLRKLTRVEV